MTDRASRAGGPVIRSEEISSADQSTLVGDGTWLHPLHADGSSLSGITVISQLHNVSFTAAKNTVYRIGGNQEVRQTMTLPLASVAGNGAIVGASMHLAGGPVWHVAVQGGDTLNFGSPYALNDNEGMYFEAISDGVSEWYVRSLILTP